MFPETGQIVDDNVHGPFGGWNQFVSFAGRRGGQQNVQMGKPWLTKLDCVSPALYLPSGVI